MPSPRPDFLAPYQADLDALRGRDRLRALSEGAGSISPPMIIWASPNPRIPRGRARGAGARGPLGPEARGYCAEIIPSMRRWRKRRRGFLGPKARCFRRGNSANEALLATLPQRGELIFTTN